MVVSEIELRSRSSTKTNLCDTAIKWHSGIVRSDSASKPYLDGLDVPKLRRKVEDLPGVRAAAAVRAAVGLGGHPDGLAGHGVAAELVVDDDAAVRVGPDLRSVS